MYEVEQALPFTYNIFCIPLKIMIKKKKMFLTMHKNICGATAPKHKGSLIHLNTDSYCPSYVNKTQQCDGTSMVSNIIGIITSFFFLLQVDLLKQAQGSAVLTVIKEKEAHRL